MSNSINILIVDDNETMRRKIKRTLSGFTCTFYEAANGEDALVLIASHTFELIILDIKLPDMTGLEVCERAKQIQPELGEVIFITGYPDDKTHAKAALLGACAYLSKAFYKSDEVRKTVSRAIKLFKRRANPVHIFISYARPDNETLSLQSNSGKIQENDLHKVQTIYDRLDENNYAPWLDGVDLNAGVYWDTEIEKAIEKCNFFLACLSPFSAKKVGYIQKEFTLAWIKQNNLQKEIPQKTYIIPIRLEDFELPPPFNQLQHIDFFNAHWFKKLKRVIKSQGRN
jgi:CheY-like chemotaxis protein